MSAVPPELLIFSHSLLLSYRQTAHLLMNVAILSDQMGRTICFCRLPPTKQYHVQIAAVKVLFTQVHFTEFTLSPAHWKR